MRLVCVLWSHQIKRKIYHESQKNDELHCGHFLIIGIYYQMGQYTRSQAFLLFSRFMLENISEFRHMLYKYNKKIVFFFNIST